MDWTPLLTGGLLGAVGTVVAGLIGASFVFLHNSRDLQLRRRLETTKVFADVSSRAHGNRPDGTPIGPGERMAALYLLADMSTRDQWLTRAAHKQLLEERELLWKESQDADAETDRAWGMYNYVGHQYRAKELGLHRVPWDSSSGVDLSRLKTGRWDHLVPSSHEASVDYWAKKRNSDSLERLTEAAAYAESLVKMPRRQRKRAAIDLDHHVGKKAARRGKAPQRGRSKLSRWLLRLSLWIDRG